MQTPSSRFSRLARFCRHGALLAGLLLLGAACDRHSATEVPESYGHGSSHQPSLTEHQIDSQKHSDHYSDTYGVREEAASEKPVGAEASKTGEAPTATPNPMGIGR